MSIKPELSLIDLSVLRDRKIKYQGLLRLVANAWLSGVYFKVYVGVAILPNSFLSWVNAYAGNARLHTIFVINAFFFLQYL